jgi:hypothetical protein
MLTRHRGPALRDLEHARRGDLLTIEPPVSGEQARVGPESTVRRAPLSL